MVMTQTGPYFMAYDANGLRTLKAGASTGVVHFTYLNGKLVAQHTFGTNERSTFIYDENGHPYAWHYVCPNGNFTPYLYITNLQGDVIRIVEANNPNNIVAQYGYNAFGAIVYQSGSMASLNPLRYRGYVFDGETGLYYLQSRYYDPILGRFINADIYATTGQGFLGYNMFVYCLNDPVNRVDHDGRKSASSTKRVLKGSKIAKIQVAKAIARATTTAALTASQNIFVATVASEAIGENTLSQQAVGHVIMNRVADNTREWRHLNTVVDVIAQPWAFTGFHRQEPQYVYAMNYLTNRTGSNQHYENLITLVMPIYNRNATGVTDITGGAQLFYSPRSMVPAGSSPSWASSNQLSEVFIYGIPSNSFRFFRYN